MQYEGHRLRHEYKYYINDEVYHVLRRRLSMVMERDEHMIDDRGYLVSSIYFDDWYHSAMNEKIAGTRFRKKFRIRCYELSDRWIRLECKSKFHEYISKEGAKLSREEYDKLMQGSYGFLLGRREAVCRELYGYHNTKGLKPVVVVEYRREAYVSPLGNVRITFDKDISSSTQTLDFFGEQYVTKKVLPNHMVVLEVKYDDYLPAHIQSILQEACTDRCAISKYVMCREENRRVKFV